MPVILTSVTSALIDRPPRPPVVCRQLIGGGIGHRGVSAVGVIDVDTVRPQPEIAVTPPSWYRH